MASWLSSKLKEAENFLQQIDQQAAESLGTQEKQKYGGISKNKRGLQGSLEPILDSSSAELPYETTIQRKLALGLTPLPHAKSKQLKKSDEGSRLPNGNVNGPILYGKKQPAAVLHVKANNSGKDDWTELLASPNANPAVSPALASSVGSSDSVHAGHPNRSSQASTLNFHKIGRNQRSDDSLLEKKYPSVTSKWMPSTSSSNKTIGGSKHTFVEGDLAEEALKRRLENDLAGLIVSESSEGPSFKNVDSRILNSVDDCTTIAEGGLTNECRAENQQWEHLRTSNAASEYDSLVDDESDKNKMCTEVIDGVTPQRPVDFLEGSFGAEDEGNFIGKDLSENLSYTESFSPLATYSSELTRMHKDVHSEELQETQASPSSSQTEEESIENSSMSDENSDRRTESEEDEEIERRKSAHKKRIARRKELSAARAAKAQASIREHKVLVEKLEKEFMSLQHVLFEREDQQGKEAAELRTSIAEVMQALETEKKLHNSARLKALSLESRLENENAELAKSLGALQWELEEEVSQFSKARRTIEAKEAAITDLERRLAKLHDGTPKQVGEITFEEKAKLKDWSFEEEQSDLWKKIHQCQIQAKDLEANICGLKDSWHVPTEPEKDLQIRLTQLTDHLLQKQAQVEALAAERASLFIRLESLVDTVDKERGLVASQTSRNKYGRRNLHWESSYDVEYALGRSYDSKGKPSGYENGDAFAPNAGRAASPFSPVLRQLNGLISAGFLCIRRHRWAQALTIMYIFVLHLWVWFFTFNNSEPTQQTPALQELALPKNIIELKNASNITNLL